MTWPAAAAVPGEVSDRLYVVPPSVTVRVEVAAEADVARPRVRAAEAATARAAVRTEGTDLMVSWSPFSVWAPRCGARHPPWLGKANLSTSPLCLSTDGKRAQRPRFARDLGRARGGPSARCARS